MAIRLIQQRRGKGSPTFTASANAVARFAYPKTSGVPLTAEVTGLLHDPTKSSVIAELLLEDNQEAFVVAGEGVYVSQKIKIASNTDLEIGNILELGNIVEGAPVFNIELVPGDGGKIARASGTFALILSKEKGSVLLKVRSGKIIKLNEKCMATIGIAAGGGRTEKPLVKAGKKYYLMKARKRFWPIVRGVAMNARDHPFGGSQHHPGKSKSTSRNAPPGRKVGAIASKRTGRKKKN